jgi:ribosomal-protein-alanine N-acetyltransferase
MSYPEIITPRLVLRLPHPSEAALLAHYYERNREHLKPVTPTLDPKLFTAAHWTSALERNRAEWDARRSMRFALFRPGIEQVVGLASITDIALGPHYACQLGYGLDQAHQGQGFMFEALTALCERVFAELKVMRIRANYMPHNLKSKMLLRRLGFVVEGYARDFVEIDGKFEDHVLSSLLNPHPEQLSVAVRR